jgi:8-oxo-dGTP pyrophosphatase MutT (NUDIX family)
MSSFEIPFDQLPDGFAESIDEVPGSVAVPRPAATIVLVRPRDAGPEILLLRRNRTVGFVPGAFVFPGGRVDADDGTPQILSRLRGVTAAQAGSRLDLIGGDPPAAAYYVAALREAFEETGLLVGVDTAGHRAPNAATDPRTRSAQLDLHGGRRAFGDILAELGITLDGGSVEYIAHWITPLAEPRRYDTRFFAAVVDADSEALPDGQEITEAVWLTPARALECNQRGELPMVFPTIKTLESLRGFRSVSELFASFANRDIPAILPRLVTTPTGVAIEVQEEGEPET